MSGNSQILYDTIYFKTNKIEVQDSNFIDILESLLKDNNTCKSYRNHSIYGVQIYKIDTTKNIHSIIYSIPDIVEKYDIDTTQNVYEAKITMLSNTGIWCSRAKGYFYINKSLFFIDGDFPNDFANITKNKKSFYYKVQKPNKDGFMLLENNVNACVLILHFKNGKWNFIEERRDY